MRFDIGTLDSGEQSLPFGLLVFFSDLYKHMYLKSLTYDNLLFVSGLLKISKEAFKMVVTLLQYRKSSQNVMVKAIFTCFYRFHVVVDESF